jgi:hypothetical protein
MGSYISVANITVIVHILSGNIKAKYGQRKPPKVMSTINEPWIQMCDDKQTMFTINQPCLQSTNNVYNQQTMFTINQQCLQSTNNVYNQPTMFTINQLVSGCWR